MFMSLPMINRINYRNRIKSTGHARTRLRRLAADGARGSALRGVSGGAGGTIRRSWEPWSVEQGALIRLGVAMARRREAFRPCIDLHNGAVKQIVGGTLKDSSKGVGLADGVVENFVSEKPSAFYAELCA